MATSFLEKNLEDIIFESDANTLYKRGLNISGKLYRQFNLGKYGIADLVLYEKKEYEDNSDLLPRADYLVTVFELKKKLIDINAFMQAIRYVSGLIFYNNEHYKNKTFQYKIVLIGSEMDIKPEFLYLPELIISDFDDEGFGINKIIDINYLKYSYDIDGIKFEPQEFFLLRELI